MSDDIGIKPSKEAWEFAEKTDERIEFPLKTDTCIGNSIWFINVQSLNRVIGTFKNFENKDVLIDHLLLQGNSINAFATRYKDKYITAIYGGLYLACLDLSFSILSTKGVLPSIGNHHLENLPSGQDIILGLWKQRYNDPKDFFLHLNERKPKCEIRNQVAHMLAIIMLSFTYLHEEGHIMLGHVDFGIDSGNYIKYQERGGIDLSDDLSKSFKHLCEIDADLFAIVRMLTTLNIRQLEKNYTNIGFNRQRYLTFSWLGCSLMASLLAIIDTRKFDKPEDWDTHPHGIIRARQTLNENFRRLLVEKQKYNKDYYLDYVSAFTDVNNNIIELSQFWKQFSVLSSETNNSFDKTAQEFIDLISDEHQQFYADARSFYMLRNVKNENL